MVGGVEDLAAQGVRQNGCGRLGHEKGMSSSECGGAKSPPAATGTAMPSTIAAAPTIRRCSFVFGSNFDGSVSQCRYPTSSACTCPTVLSLCFFPNVMTTLAGSPPSVGCSRGAGATKDVFGAGSGSPPEGRRAEPLTVSPSTRPES